MAVVQAVPFPMFGILPAYRPGNGSTQTAPGKHGDVGCGFKYASGGRGYEATS